MSQPIVKQRTEPPVSGRQLFPSRRTLSVLLRILIVPVSLILLICYYPIFPGIVVEFCDASPECGWMLVPSLSFIYATLPAVAAALVLFWCICADIGKDKAFTMTNAQRLKWIGIFALTDTVIVTACFLFLWINEWMHPLVFVFFFIVGVFGLSVSVTAFLLAHLIGKAAVLQDDADLTV